LQAWLQSLLAPGTVIPDGAVAHISLEGQQLQATWQQEQGSWVVAQQGAEELSVPPYQLSLLHMEHAVTRLPPGLDSGSKNQSSASAQGGVGISPGVHRVQLLLGLSSSAPELVFKGSDSTSAPVQQPGDSNALMTVYCMARGSWGTWLPVTVVGTETAAPQGSADEATSPMKGDDGSSSIALTVSCCIGKVNHRCL
jgi:hypothetical protein